MLKDPNAGTGGAHLSEWLEGQAGGALKILTSVRFMKSPGGKNYAFVCGVDKMMGLKSQIAAFLVTLHGGKHIIGDITFLKVVKEHVEPVKRVKVSETHK